jgi:hypothetical protein
VHWQEHLIKEEDEEEDEEEEEEEKLVEQTDDGSMESAMPEEDGVQNKKNTVSCVRCHKEIDKSCKQVGISCLQKDLLTNTSIYQTGSFIVDIFVGKEVSHITFFCIYDSSHM